MEITGLDQLMGALNVMRGEEFAKQALMKGLKNGGKLIQGTAKNLCPVDTGQLRNSIEVTEIENGVDIGTNVEYAQPVEYGTGSLGDPSVPHTTKGFWHYQDKDGNWVTGKPHAPQPFLFPAVKAHEKQIPDIVAVSLQNEINKAVGK